MVVRWNIVVEIVVYWWTDPVSQSPVGLLRNDYYSCLEKVQNDAVQFFLPFSIDSYRELPFFTPFPTSFPLTIFASLWFPFRYSIPASVPWFSFKYNIPASVPDSSPWPKAHKPLSVVFLVIFSQNFWPMVSFPPWLLVRVVSFSIKGSCARGNTVAVVSHSRDSGNRGLRKGPLGETGSSYDLYFY